MTRALKYAPEGLLFVAIGVALFYQSGYMPLSADEPIRALIALDMVLNGHFLAPELNGDLYLNKPPLYNWILFVFFQTMETPSEFLIRLPSLISLLLFMPLIASLGKSYVADNKWVWVTAFAFVTSGNLWFYSSYLGHIDVLFSLVTFGQIFAIIHFSKKEKWWMCFLLSYALAAVSFMMKGLPSIAFQGITLITCLLILKRFKQLFSISHVVGFLVFVLPILLYLFAYSSHGDPVALLNKLLTESTDRTVTDKTLIQSIVHIFAFPFLFLTDIMPWGLFLFVFLFKDVRRAVWSQPFHKICLWVFGANLIVYWMSPDYLARYVFMLIPFLFFPMFEGVRNLGSRIPLNWFKAFAILTGFAIASMVVFVKSHLPNVSFIALFLLLSGVGICFLLLWKQNHGSIVNRIFVMVALLVLLRISYSTYMVPFRVANGPYLSEKEKANQMASIVGNDSMFMYHSNVSLTMNWYLSAKRHQMLTTRRNGFSLDSYFLVPMDVLVDRENVQVFDTFVRRFESKPFGLVKFKSFFPPMPKKQ